MRKSFQRKLFSRLLLLVMLTVALHGVHESAHAMQYHMAAASDRASSTEISASQQCPCAPGEQHKDSGGCDICVNCDCHAPLTVHPFQLSYNPSILELCTSDPFKFLPEVYLPKFIPPQNQA